MMLKISRLKALRLMQESELVLYPASCPFEFVDLCRRDADREDMKIPTIWLG